MTNPVPSELLLKHIAEQAAHEAVKETLLKLGIDTNNPIEAQRDMQALREVRKIVEDREFQEDLVHIRKWRKNLESIENKGMFAVVSMLFLGAAGIILYAFRMKF